MQRINNKNFKFDKTGKSLAIFPKKKNFVVNFKLINELKLLSRKNNNQNVRICLHKNKKEKLHNMIIFLSKKNLSPIHKHIFTDEIYQIIYGILKIKIFNKNKKLLKVIEISNKKSPIFRMKKNILHQTIPASDHVIFHECRLSPYKIVNQN
jgi:cupin fold WbuC family metalloprotein